MNTPDTKPVLIEIKQEEGGAKDFRLEVAEIGYGFGSGGGPSMASIICRDIDGKRLLCIQFPEQLLDPNISNQICKLANAGYRKQS